MRKNGSERFDIDRTRAG